MQVGQIQNKASWANTKQSKLDKYIKMQVGQIQNNAIWTNIKQCKLDKYKAMQVGQIPDQQCPQSGLSIVGRHKPRLSRCMGCPENAFF